MDDWSMEKLISPGLVPALRWIKRHRYVRMRADLCKPLIYNPNLCVTFKKYTGLGAATHAEGKILNQTTLVCLVCWF